MRILLTGAAGFIGSHLAEALLELGHEVSGIDCLTNAYARQLKELNLRQLVDKGLDFVDVDLATAELRSICEGVDVLYHLAAQPGISASVPFDTYVRNNIVATQRILEAAASSTDLKGFVNISTSSVYGADATGPESTVPQPTSYYGVSKLAAEQLALSYHRERELPACSMRLFSVYGPRERPEKLYPKLIGSILEDRPFPMREGSEAHVRSFTYVSDIVDGLVAVLDNLDTVRGEIFNIGTDVAMTTAEGVRIVEQIIGAKAKIEMKPALPGDQMRTKANIDKARAGLGYNPTTSAEAGLEQAVNWYRQFILGKIDLWGDR